MNGSPLPTKRRRFNFRDATLIVAVAGLIWRVARYLANWPLWGDEAFIAVSVITRGFHGLTQPLEYYQIAPPGFLWIERLAVSLMGASELVLRLQPFLCGVASLWLFYRFATRTIDRRSALMAVAMFAASFYPIRHANEVKPYAGDLLLAQAITMLGWAILKRPERWTTWGALTVVSVIGVWISYPLIFVSSGLGIFLAWRVRDDRRLLLVSAIFVSLTCISWAAMYGLIAKPQADAAPFLTSMTTWENSFPPLDRPWRLPLWFIQTHTGNMMAYPYGGNDFGSSITTILVLAGIYSLWRKNRTLLLLLLTPIPPALAAAALHRYPYGTSARIALFLAPAICLLAGAGISELVLRLSIPRFKRFNYAIITAGFVIAALAGAVFSIAVPYKDIDDRELRDVVRAIAAKTEPGDRWVVLNGLTALPRDNGIMLKPWLQHTAQFRYYVLCDASVPFVWNPEPHTQLPSHSGRTWLIVHDAGFEEFLDSVPQQFKSQLAPLGATAQIRADIRFREFVEASVYPSPR